VNGPRLEEDVALARAIASAALSVAGVAHLSEAPGGAATRAPGESIRGVAVRRSGAGQLWATVELVAEYRPRENLRELADRVRRAALRAARETVPGGVAGVDVAVHDVAVPAE
jgi:uncharacterized alkaline shock family protein YloU